MKLSPKNILLPLLFLLALVLPTSGKAYTILFYYNNDGAQGSDATKLSTILTGLGHVVTLKPIVAGNYDPNPDNWSAYDQVWDMRYVNGNNAGCGTGSTAYRDYFTIDWVLAATNYLNNCGKFFTFMENAAFDGRNAGLYTFLNGVGATTSFSCADSDTTTGDNSSVVSGVPGASFLFTEFAGGIPVGKLNGTVFASQSTGWTNVQTNRALAVGWDATQLNGLLAPVACRGRMFLVTDFSMWFFYPATLGGLNDNTDTANFFSAAATWLGNAACACGPTPTPTDTPTATFTPTITDTPTVTSTPTLGITDTPTPSPTPTLTLTPTITFTPTVTFTPKITATPTPSLHVWPNPFDPKYAWAENGQGVLRAYFVPPLSTMNYYTVSGELVQTLQEGKAGPPGYIDWNGFNLKSMMVSSGIYYYVIKDKSGNVLLTGKVLIQSEH